MLFRIKLMCQLFFLGSQMIPPHRPCFKTEPKLAGITIWLIPRQLSQPNLSLWILARYGWWVSQKVYSIQAASSRRCQGPWMQIQFYLHHYGKYFHFCSCFNSRCDSAQIVFWLNCATIKSQVNLHRSSSNHQNVFFFSSSLVLVFKSHPIWTVILHVTSVLLVSERKYTKYYKYF